MQAKTKFPIRRFFTAVLVIGLALILAVPAGAGTNTVPSFDYATPLFGLSITPGGTLFVADAGSGVVRLGKEEGILFAELPGVSDVDPIRPGVVYGLTGLSELDTAQKLFRVTRDETREIADLGEFEAEVNPDGGVIDSNPFDVEALSEGRALVADAGGNDLLIVDREGNVDWIATLPAEEVSTENIKELAGCPDAPPDFVEFCDLPPRIPAEAVATSVVVGPDGAYYVGELKGFPGPVNESRIWRIEPDARHVVCGESPDCEVVADGFTSIVDLTLGPDDTLYVVEIDEASFMAAEFLAEGIDVLAGGTVNACDTSTWECTEEAEGLTIPIGAAVNDEGTIYVAIKTLMPDAEVIALP